MAKKKEVVSDKAGSKGKNSNKKTDKKTEQKSAGNGKAKEKNYKNISKKQSKKKEDESPEDKESDGNVNLPEEIPLEEKPVLTVKSLSKSFKRKLVLKDLGFEVCERDIFGVVGMSGSGKTTLFQLMAGVLNQTSGDVLVRRDLIYEKDDPSQPDYVSVYKNAKKVRKQIGFASQTPSFYEHLTVRENLKLYGSMYGMKKKILGKRIKELARLVGLEEEKETVSKNLSGGMQRRLDIACALIHEPKILYLDEPTSDLDPVMRLQLWSLIKDINKQGTTIILASHILEEVELLCTKIAILHDKHVVGYGSLDELKQLFSRFQEVKIRLASQEYEKLMKRLKKAKITIERMFEKEGVLVVYIPKEEKDLSKILKTIEKIDEKVVSLDVSETHLTEIFEMFARKKMIEAET